MIEKQEITITDKTTLEALKEHLPFIFNNEGKIDFEKLKQHLGESVIKDQEYYSFKWTGKEDCIKLISKPTRSTLKPNKNKSIEFDNTNNVFVEGDNLEVLKLFQNSYNKSIDVIYIDPPYNKDDDYVYSDKWSDGLETYLNYIGMLEEGKIKSSKAFSNEMKSGSKHSNWLSMMYPRLFLSRNLLKDEGFIFISIDEDELYNLKKIMDEIYGEENFVGNIIWDKRNPKGNVEHLSNLTEYIVVYAKNKNNEKTKGKLITKKNGVEEILKKADFLYKKINTEDYPQDIEKIIKNYQLNNRIQNIENLKVTYTLDYINKEFKKYLKNENFKEGLKAYKEIDINGEVYRGISMEAPNKSNNQFDIIHPLTNKKCKTPNNGWRFKEENLQNLLEKKLIIFGKDETTIPNRKIFLKDYKEEAMNDLFSYAGNGMTDIEKIEINKNIFDNPKPLDLLKYLLSFTHKDSLILDFFAGSGSTFHSVMDLNKEDKGNRKVISIQLPEIPDFTKGNNKKYNRKEMFEELNLKTIADLTRKRMEKAGTFIKKSNTELDIGYKTFELSETNIIENQEITEEDFINNKINNVRTIKENTIKEDLLYQIYLLKGIKLCEKQNMIQNLEDTYQYKVNNQNLIISLNENLSVENIKVLKDLNPDEIIFIESYLEEEVKLNIKHILQKQFNIKVMYI